MMYTALVLNEDSKSRLMQRFAHLLPADWDRKGHHMTVNMGLAAKGPAAEMLGKEFDITVVSLGIDGRVIAVGVETEVPSNNARKHITLAVNVDAGAKPKHSNEIPQWDALNERLFLKGIVSEVA